MNIDPHVLESIKRMHLPTIVERYGIQLHKNGWLNRTGSYKINCPFHEDKTPSLHLTEKNGKWVWNCFGCQAHGNTFDFLMKMDKSEFNGTYLKYGQQFMAGGMTDDAALSARVNGSGSSVKPPNVAPPVLAGGHSAPPVNRAALLAQAVKMYHDAFLEDFRGRDYLAERGIKAPDAFKAFQIGYTNGRLTKMLPDDPAHEINLGLKAVGVLNGKGNEFFHGCVVFPITDENGAVVNLYGRRIAEHEPAHLYLAGQRRGVWNGAAAKAHQDLILTESIIDALSLYSVGVENAVPLYGVNGLTEDHLRLFREHRTQKVSLCFDNDDAGREARGRIKEKLAALGVAVADVTLPTEYKDVNEALQKGFTAEQFKNTFRPPPPHPLPLRGEGKDGAGHAPADGPHVTQTDDAVHVDFGARRYRVRGLAAKSLGALRVNIKVECAGGHHLDTFDLYSAKSRAAFVACCRKIFEAPEGELNRELNRIVEELESLRVSQQEEKAAGEEIKMTEEEGQAALAALKSPKLLADVLADMDALGYVGEDHNKAIGYLVGISRKLEDPLSCVIISQSSAGKSVLADTVERMTPPEDVFMFSRATQYAFYYAARFGFKHKLLISEERAGSEESDYPIRSLQSKKRLTLAVPVKDPATNQMKMEERVVEGPVAYMETTTKPRIHDENATRCFELFLDETEDQTRRIHNRQRRAKTLAGFLSRGETESLVNRHRNMQRLLTAVAVVIPYADLIEFPVRWLRTRRDNARFLNLIEVISFLHQHQRPRRQTPDNREYIEATVQDYAAAYSLAREIMGESFADLKKPQRELLGQIEKLVKENGGGEGGVTRRQIREATGLADTRLRDLLGDLVSLEYLRQVDGGGRGNTCRYMVLERGPEGEKRLAGLTTPEELEKRLAAVR